jgi:hypothetical protein
MPVGWSAKRRMEEFGYALAVQENRAMMNIVIAVLAALGVTLYSGAPVTAFLCAAALGIVALFLIDILSAR